MVLEIIAASILIAIGLMAIYFSIEKGISDRRLLLIIILGFLAILGGAWIIISNLTLGIILTKLAGLILAAFGLFLVIGFPGITDYQPAGMGRAGIFIGLILLIIGIYLLLF